MKNLYLVLSVILNIVLVVVLYAMTNEAINLEKKLQEEKNLKKTSGIRINELFFKFSPSVNCFYDGHAIQCSGIEEK
jgi:hypothetical protein